MMLCGVVCQRIGSHDLALAACQVLVARRGRYHPNDHPFISKSLRELAPGPVTERVLERLAGEQVTALRLIAPAQDD
jgi:hypothetical protein